MRLLLPRPSPLHWAIAVSVGVHALALGVRFVDPAGWQRAFRDVPLEVVLVNARSDERPAQAQAIAQASLAGGGDAERGRATSPLPATAQLEVGDAPADAHRRIDHLQEEQQQLLAQIRREIAALPSPDPQRDSGRPQDDDADERRRQLLRLLAEIETRVNDDSARPRKRYVSPATREAPYAIYYDALRRRIEERGTRDFPSHQGRKLYGELTMNLTVDRSGRIVDAEVVRSSSQRVLDQRALAIVHAAAPFGPFNDAMRRQADQIVVTSRFHFTRDEALATSLSQ